MAAYTMDPVSDSITELSGYLLYAEAIPGSNGDSTGIPTYDLGADPEDASYGYNVWDEGVADGDTSDGFDTGSQPFAFDSDMAGGSNSLDVASAGAISYDTGGSQSIGSVIVRAGIQTIGVATWNNVTIAFYQGSTLADTLTLDGPAVDTTPANSPDEAEQILLVTPDSSSTPYTRVTVSGSIQMQTPAGVLPGPDDLFCQVFIFPTPSPDM